jgi:mannitol-1-phosphate/altronate dehydrogenase
VSGFLGGELAINRASLLTVQRLDNMSSRVTGDTATVDFDYTEGGYNIDPSTGKATETQSVLAPVHVTATLKRVAGRWLMDSYTSHLP